MKKPLISIVVALTLAVLIYGAALPSLNWDVVGYVASSYYGDNLAGEELLQKTYSDIKKVASKQQYIDIVQGNQYRTIVSSSPTSLTEHLPFYTIRVAYIWIVRLAGHLFSQPYALWTYLISAFFGSLCVVAFGFFLSETKNISTLLIFPLILIFSGLFPASTLSTPDTMASFIALLTLHLFFRDHRFLLPALAAIPLIRTDYVLLAPILGICYVKRGRYSWGLGCVMMPVLTYYLVNHVHQNYGFLKIFNFTLIELNPFPSQLVPATTPGPYIQAYFNGFKKFIEHRHFILYLGLFIFWFRFIKPRKLNVENEKIFITLSFVLLHLLLFPAYYERFFIWNACLAGILLVQWIFEPEFKHSKASK